MSPRTPPRQRLARPKSELEARYDAIVVGSGYGGGIAALRLAEAGLRVCVLERGTELLPEELPASLRHVPANVQGRVDTPGMARRFGPRLGLFDLRIHESLGAVVGCGVGGTSLINASVFVVPEEHVLDHRWPARFREDREGREAACARAREILTPTTAGPEVAKMGTFRELAAQTGVAPQRVPLMVRRTDDDSPGARGAVCTGCGNCVSGCVVGAKRSVDMTYLPLAVAAGARVFAELDVHHVARSGDEWSVHYAPTCRPARQAEHPDGFPCVRARLVILAGGALGSTEILARSRERGLAVSDALGTSFSANGNAIGAVYAPRHPVRANGTDGRTEPEPGPCITTAVDLPATERRGAIHVEDGTAPLLLTTVGRALGLGARLRAQEPGQGRWARALATSREVLASVAEGVVGAPENGQLLLAQCDDGAKGRLELGAAGIAIRWPDYEVPHVDAELRKMAEAAGATYQPLRTGWGAGAVQWTVHPLGGCPMGESHRLGVVNDACAVFDPDGPLGAVHPGLYVCDASVIPAAVGKNPVGTICTIAERAMHLLVATERTVDRSPAVAGQPTERRRSFALSEAFEGWLSCAPADAPNRLAVDAFAEPFAHHAQAAFAIEMDDLTTFVRDANHSASVVGTLTCALLGGTCSVVRGHVHLLADDPVDQHVFYNMYRLGLASPVGEAWTLTGMKVWEDGGATKLWSAGTQMPIEIFRGEDTSGAPFARGLLRMSARDFLGSVRSYEGRVRGAVPIPLEAHADFLAFSARRLLQRVRWPR
ncbi:MAG: GMC family oxidoreductase [Polyangiaceae bacterium]|nr:GMC family oxidoreductase [Polyangiaceae bacterium]